jgi:hypothetical protein
LNNVLSFRALADFWCEIASIVVCATSTKQQLPASSRNCASLAQADRPISVQI